KYTRDRVRVAVEEADVVRVLVDDNGSGIPESVRTEVLKRGARADLATSGQGIGLAVVVEIVAAYDGRLAIQDSELGGARVVLELPA
ncbi:MAG: ATP-binding protein, partial [Gammaproteobacteria bacterium]|nr:ATP-binding protein [Gammaproteobacteria bacterium]